MRYSKIIIVLLSICTGVLGILLLKDRHDRHERAEELLLNIKSNIVSSTEINSLADVLEEAKHDTSELGLYYDYEWIREDRHQWNNSRVFNLAYMAIQPEVHSENLADMSWDFLDASTQINTLLVTRHDSNELKPGELDSLITYMRRLAHATESFENTTIDE